MQQARDLASGVWRDAAVAVGVFAIRFGLDAAKAAAAQTAFAVIFLLVATYVGLSFWIATTINERYLTNAATSRMAFRAKLYAYLDDDDYRALAEKPVREAVQDYRSIERRTRYVVMVVIAALIAASFAEAREPLSSAAAWIHRTASSPAPGAPADTSIKHAP